ncbi:hypothetical protein E6O75_ATG02907 [Venturia nashicola]|uniref:Uncharacterized protein n=1 Tax=Venturia nashicola TaxID=86259 RepID=A0A4Z1PPG3_9PEZI|nr:hypothetical protein E6O75_ATG02907 [Venturia nashicola]
MSFPAFCPSRAAITKSHDLGPAETTEAQTLDLEWSVVDGGAQRHQSFAVESSRRRVVDSSLAAGSWHHPRAQT